MKTTLVIGASTNPERYSYMATKLLVTYQHKVFAIGNKIGKIGDIEILVGKPPLQNIHTVTLYLSEKYQQEYYDYILSLKPQRIIFNPGTENNELLELAETNNISAIVACTLVLLKTGQY
jgi:uncharacterized protein